MPIIVVSTISTPVRVHHPLKQGLRLACRLHLAYLGKVRVHHPLKQGLRQVFMFPFFFSIVSTSASSIKTRIKTFNFLYFNIKTSSSTSASSIKTRIKTTLLDTVLPLTDCVRVHHPLKQGLRPILAAALMYLSNWYECIIH